KKKRKKRKKKTSSGVRTKKDHLPEKIEVEEKTSPNKKKKYILYLIPVLVIVVGALLFRILRPKNEIQMAENLNIVIVTLDTLRADRLGCYGYEKAETPHLDEIARMGVKFENTVCQSPLTLPSHASIFTGLYPLYHQIRDNGAYYLDERFQTLAEIFKEKSYNTAAFVGAFPVDSRFGLDQGFTLYEDNFKEDEKFKAFYSERRAEEVFNAFQEWFLKNFQTKFFVWIHYYDPHLPYDPPPPYRERFLDPYDGEVAYTDFFVGKIMELLRERKVFENTLIVIAGDHGEGLGDHREIDHGLFLYNSTLKVPFIICAPQNLPPQSVVTSQVRLIDIYPTVLDLFNLSIPEEIQGESLVPLLEGKKREDLVSYIETFHPQEMFRWAALRGIVDGRMKYIDAPKQELYDMQKDPQEEHNIFQEEKKIAAQMKEDLESLIERYSSGTSSQRELSSDEKEKLLSLGYIIDRSPRENEPDDLPDPKDKIDVWYTLQVARGLQRRGDNAKAEGLYKKGIMIDPHCSLNYLFLGGLYLKDYKLQEAYDVFKKGTRAVPESLPLHDGLAKTAIQMGKYQEALEECEVMLALNDRYFNALSLAGFVHNRLGENEKAVEYLRKAAAIEPENKLLLLDLARVLATSGRTDEAIDVYNRLIVYYPKDHRIYQSMGITYGEIGDLEKSIESLKKAIELRPTALAFFNLGVALETTGKTDEAINYLKAYLRTTPEGDTPRKRMVQEKVAHWEKRQR
ncbi:MAG: sulfatase-like hydrolase/transferase, partial [Candidatus Aminicenantes bacterium]